MAWFIHLPDAWQGLGGRELTLGPVTMSSLRISRRVYLPSSGGYTRLLETLSNTTPGAITVSINIGGTYGEPHPLLPIAPTQNGGRFAVQASAQSGLPIAVGAAGYVFGGAGAPGPTVVNFAAGQNTFGWRWNVTVPAGQQVSFLEFIVVHPASDENGVETEVNQLTNAAQSGMFDGLSPTDRSAIKNFSVPPPGVRIKT